MVKSKEKRNASNACKRSRSDDKVDRSTNEVTVDMSTTNEVEPVKKAVKKTVKGKIDFNQNDEKVKNTRSTQKLYGLVTMRIIILMQPKQLEMCIHKQGQVLTMPKMKLQVGCNGPKNF